MLQASRETGALKEAKDKLEKRVEELTWRLQLEKSLRVRYMFCGQIKYGGCYSSDIFHNHEFCKIAQVENKKEGRIKDQSMQATKYPLFKL